MLLLLLLWRGNTHTNNLFLPRTATDVHRLRRPLLYPPSHSDGSQAPRNVTSHTTAGYTTTPAWCWASCCGVDCLESVICTRSLPFSHAPLRHLSASLTAAGAIVVIDGCQSLRPVPYILAQSLQSSHVPFRWYSAMWPNTPA